MKQLLFFVMFIISFFVVVNSQSLNDKQSLNCSSHETSVTANESCCSSHSNSANKKDTIIRCYAVEYNNMLKEQRRKKGEYVPTEEEFEKWVQEKINESFEKGNALQGILYIPVVVHVVHNGDAIGTERNISDAQVHSQIEVLNEDFRKIYGARGWNDHPDGSDTEIEFVFTKRDLAGNAFNRINRINRNVRGWTAPPHTSTYVKATIKPNSIWNPNEYFNFWYIDLGGDLLGWTTFPEAASLPGMDCTGTYQGNMTNDGVVILYTAFGSSDKKDEVLRTLKAL